MGEKVLMSENETNKKKLKGLPKIVAKEVEPLNRIEKFKEDFKDKVIKILLNPKDGKKAALIVIDHGRIYVESIDNEPKENIKKKTVGWDGFFQTDTKTFADLLGGEDITVGQIVAKILTFRAKIRGIKNVLVILKLFEY